MPSSPSNFTQQISHLHSSTGHPHLVQLLWTYNNGPNYHLVFPWADGNLRDFWEIHNMPIPDQAGENHHRRAAVWFARQCLGIAQGLHAIHKRGHDSVGDIKGKEEPGWHGDLSLDNILWFRDFDSLGALKISLSMTTSGSNSVFPNDPYRPPECNIDMYRSIFTACDIWALACILLDFVTWFLEGGQGIEKFKSAILADADNYFVKSVFFSYVEVCDEHGTPKTFARVKGSVVNVSNEATYSHHG